MHGESASTTVQDNVTAGSFRLAVGSFCTGLTVISAMGPDGPVGFTCQAFSSLSLDPPRILVCPGRTSTTWPVIRGVGRFCVNVLAADQTDLSRRFARSGGNKYVGLQWSCPPGGSPRLDGACSWLECATETEFDAGDHFVVAARVLALDTVEDRKPLLYHRGRYASLAESAAGPT
ncbi:MULTISPECIES: flavin reductase family protein [unclassified Streptomyces]|uniref:flavin reductase family protein n=1 Tax=unclassified Streptomyces TaxID=2593676 RepID=UPI00324DFE72